MLRLECRKCSRKGHKLIAKYGRKGNMLNGDCPKRDAHSIQERCDLVCPDLPKVVTATASPRGQAADVVSDATSTPTSHIREASTPSVRSASVTVSPLLRRLAVDH